jgi:hypothetical protein
MRDRQFSLKQPVDRRRGGPLLAALSRSVRTLVDPEQTVDNSASGKFGMISLEWLAQFIRSWQARFAVAGCLV